MQNYKKIKLRFESDIEPQEIFLDRLAQKKEAEIGISKKKIEFPLPKKVLWGFLFFSIILILILFAKTFQLQILENKKFLALAEENKFLIYSIQATRGVIYDSSGKQLVFNKASFDLVLNKREFFSQADCERTKILEEISQIIDENPAKIEEKINTEKKNKVLISGNIDHQELVLLETKIEKMPGFEIERRDVREYIGDKNFSHLIGYTGRITAEELKENPEIYSAFDYVGKDGLEKSYEKVLRKKSGKLRIERDAFGNVISKEIVSLPESGKSLVLWLDSDLQKKIEEELENAFLLTGAEKAIGVALDPKNGGVLALVSLPSFNNNLFSEGIDSSSLNKLLTDERDPLFNRVISGKYPTGSTIKPIIAAAALEEKIISPAKSINCQGKIIIPHPYDPERFTEKKDWRVHGLTDLRKAIAESCNVYFYTIGGGYKDQDGLGPTRIKKYLELFSWGNRTGIDLPGEATGFIPTPEWKKKNKNEKWWDGDTYNLSIGQGDILVTPLQVATAFAAIANGGTLYRPSVVKEIIDNEKNIVEKIKPEVLRENFIKAENLQIVKEGMRKAVTGAGAPYASAVLLNSLPVAVAAKTGTAQTPMPDFYHNWITVFAPYDNPQIVLTIMVENVRGAQVVALPIAKEILQWYFTK